MIKIIFVSFIVCFGNLYANGTGRLVWPSPPDEAKIEYIKSIRQYNNLGVEKGFFTKVLDFVFGDEDSRLGSPFGIHVCEKRLYITDISSKTLYIYDKTDYDEISIRGSGDENFEYPIDVITDKKGDIYVSDSVKSKIYVFNSNGDFKFIIKPQNLQRPVGLAIDELKGLLYIVDAVSSQVFVTTLKGKYIKTLGTRGSGNGQFNRPTFIDIAKNGNLYISDSMNHRVQVIDGDGNYIHSFGKLSNYIGGFGNPRGIALDSDENVYISDTMYNTIQIFNKNGELLMVFGNYGFRAGQFSLPEDISISNDNKIYITDTNNKRVQVFQLLNEKTKVKKGSSK